MTITLKLIQETNAARLYENKDGQQQWIPRSVCRKTLKFPPKPGEHPLHEVEIADWFLAKNTWPTERQLL